MCLSQKNRDLHLCDHMDGFLYTFFLTTIHRLLDLQNKFSLACGVCLWTQFQLDAGLNCLVRHLHCFSFFVHLHLQSSLTLIPQVMYLWYGNSVHQLVVYVPVFCHQHSVWTNCIHAVGWIHHRCWDLIIASCILINTKDTAIWILGQLETGDFIFSCNPKTQLSHYFYFIFILI